MAGGFVLNRDGPRVSADIDIFHDREESVAVTADLVDEAFAIDWVHREPGLHAASSVATTTQRGWSGRATATTASSRP